MGELIAITNSCHTEAEKLVSFLSDVMTKEEFNIYVSLINGTENEIREFEDSTIQCDEEDNLSAQFDLFESLIDQNVDAKLLSVAYEIAIKLSDTNLSPEYAEQLIDFWLDAYASSLGGGFEAISLLNGEEDVISKLS